MLYMTRYALLILFLPIILMSCGGGGGSGGSDPSGNTPTPPTTPPTAPPAPPTTSSLSVFVDGQEVTSDLIIHPNQEVSLTFEEVNDSARQAVDTTEVEVEIDPIGPDEEIRYENGKLTAALLGTGRISFNYSDLNPVDFTVAVVPSEETGLQSFNELDYADDGVTDTERVIHMVKYKDETHFIFIREYNLSGVDRSGLYTTKILRGAGSTLSYDFPKKIIDLDGEFELDDRFLGQGEGRYFDLYDGNRESQEYFFFGKRPTTPDRNIYLYTYDFSTGRLNDRSTLGDGVSRDEFHYFYDSRGYLILMRWKNLGIDDEGEPRDGKYIQATALNLRGNGPTLIQRSMKLINFPSRQSIDKDTLFLSRDNEMIAMPKTIRALNGGMFDNFETVKINPNSTAPDTGGGLETNQLWMRIGLEGQNLATGHYTILHLDMLHRNLWNIISLIDVEGGLNRSAHSAALQRIRGSNGYPTWVPLDEEPNPIPPIATENITKWEPGIYASVYTPETNEKHVYRDNSDGEIVWSFDMDNPNGGWPQTLNRVPRSENPRELISIAEGIFNFRMKQGANNIPYLLASDGIFVKYHGEPWVNPDRWDSPERVHSYYVTTHNAFLFLIASGDNVSGQGLPDLYFRYAY